MGAIKYLLMPGLAACLFLAGCAISPEAEEARQQREADIQEILSYELDPAEYGETKRCLADREYRSYKALDSQRMLFYGRSDKQWINTLRTSCIDLRHGDVLVIESFSAHRICESDRFAVGDWFDWPWYRRWPWHWGRTWGTGMSCSFGKFQPVSAEQVAEIEALLDR